MLHAKYRIEHNHAAEYCCVEKGSMRKKGVHVKSVFFFWCPSIWNARDDCKPSNLNTGLGPLKYEDKEE